MKILVVTQYFYPENFRINQLCLELKKRGHEVTVLTGKPNYPQGKYYSGYSYKGNEDEVWNGIPVIRSSLRERKTGSVNLLLNYISFVIHANRRIKDLKNEYDLIYVFEVSPVTVALPAIKIKKKYGVPIIMNVQDLWPENIVAVTKIDNKLVIGLVNCLVDYIYKNCDLLLMASPGFVKRVGNRVKNTSKLKYWPQYSNVKKACSSSIIYDKKKFNIVFTGNIGEAQGLDIAIEAAKILKDEGFHWHFVGDGRNRDHLADYVKKYKLEDVVTFYGQKPENEIPSYLFSADAALLILKPDPVFDMTIPAKLQTYLSCGIPIIGCVSGESKDIIKDANAGVVSDTVSVDGLVAACRQIRGYDAELFDNMKHNAERYGAQNFNKEILLNKLEGYMEGLCRNSKIKH